MEKNKAILISAGLTILVLVLTGSFIVLKSKRIGGSSIEQRTVERYTEPPKEPTQQAPLIANPTMRRVSTAVATPSLVPTLVVTPTTDPAIEGMLKEYEAMQKELQDLKEQQQQLQQTNQRLQETIQLLQEVQQTEVPSQPEPTEPSATHISVEEPTPTTPPPPPTQQVKEPTLPPPTQQVEVPTTPPPPKPNQISAEEAIAIAQTVILQSALAGQPELIDYHGRTVYRVVFSLGEVYVDAMNGEVVYSYMITPTPQATATPLPTATPAEISSERAIAIAIAYMGGGEVTSIIREEAGGMSVYRVDFRNGSKVYVDTATGMVAYADVRERGSHDSRKKPSDSRPDKPDPGDGRSQSKPERSDSDKDHADKRQDKKGDDHEKDD